MRVVLLLAGLALALCVGCNDDPLIASPSQTDNTGDPGDPSNPTDPGNPDDPTPTDGDRDGDGIPDIYDNIDCEAFVLKIENNDVSSATVLVNNEEVAGSDYFPSSDVIWMYINPVQGQNELSLGGKLRGSPDDWLHFVIYGVLGGEVYLDETLVRENGTPPVVRYVFDVDVDCDQV